MVSPNLFQHFGKEWSSQVLAGQKVCPESFRREFELEDILDYIKTGIGSIIEDEVTQRFVAEDLKVKKTAEVSCSYRTVMRVIFAFTLLRVGTF